MGFKNRIVMVQRYNFDEIIDRTQTDSVKWSINDRLFGKKDVLSMWVADMDFRSPEPVVRALVERAEHGVFGYTNRSESNFLSVIDWLKKRHGWETNQAWQVTTPGVVPGIIAALLAFTLPGDKVVIQPPVYYPFFKVVLNNGRQIVENNLIENHGYYTMDFDTLDQQLSDPRVRMMLLCSPHNPIGRVWTREELSRLGELCLRHGVLLVSDEIHSDLVFSWAKHTPVAMISPEVADDTIALLAPSKTFNLAGLHTSVVIIPNSTLRERYSQTVENLGIGGNTIFGLAALETAFREGEEWLIQLLAYLEKNMLFLEDFFRAEIPQIRVLKPEGTYLVWLDCRALGMSREELKQFMIQKAELGLNEGGVFGKSGEGFMRLNAGCPRAVLKQGLEHLASAVKSL
jgi:cystathionine beta-lyase